MLAHCFLYQRPQDWQLLKAIGEDLQSEPWASFRSARCQYCAKGDVPAVLDEDGVDVLISKEAGTWSHAIDDSWWPCEAFNLEADLAQPE